MPREPRKYLYDVQEAADRIADFVDGRSFSDCRQDDLLRSAVERQFEITGEALASWQAKPPCLPSGYPSTGESSPFATS